MNNESRLKGKLIKNYSLEDTMVKYQNGSQLVQGFRDNKYKVSIYALQKKIIDQESYLYYNNSISENSNKIYPKLEDLVQSEKFLYLVFQQLKWPSNGSIKSDAMLQDIQNILKHAGNKISANELFETSNNRLVYFPSYKKVQTVSKFYSEVHNKAIFAQLYCSIIPTNDKNAVYQLLIKELGNNNIKKLLQPYLIKNSQYNHQPKIQIKQQKQSKNTFQESYYPDLEQDDSEIFQLMSGVKVNPHMKQEAGNFMRASSRARHQQQPQTKQIKNIVQNVKSSMFDIKIIKDPLKSSKFKCEISMNPKKHQKSQFQLYFRQYVSIFRHFKKTVKSFLQFYKNGYAGVISAYFITLIGILRRSKMVYDLMRDQNIFDISMKNVDLAPYLAVLKKDLVSQAKILTDLRQIIQGSYIPMRTYQILAPFLEDHIQQIDSQKLQDFCFFFMTNLFKNNFKKEMHFLYTIQFLYIILHRNYQIVHFSNDFPNKWDQDYFQLRKTLIQTMVPNWKL